MGFIAQTIESAKKTNVRQFLLQAISLGEWTHQHFIWFEQRFMIDAGRLLRWVEALRRLLIDAEKFSACLECF